MAKWSGSENSWERQPNESQKAYEALYLYLQLGEDRSLRKVEQKLNKSHALIGRWSTTWNWVQRARDYDTELRRKELSAKKAEIKKMQTRQMQTAVLLQKKAVEALENLKAETIDPKDILRFIVDGAKLERELMTETAVETAKETGAENGGSATLADTIISAYKRRREDGQC